MTRDIIIYTVGNVINRFCSLLIFPLYAKTLSEEEFALQDVSISLAALISLVASLGLESGYARRFFDEDTAAHRNNLASTWGWATLVSCGLLLAVALLGSKSLTTTLIGSSANPEILMWCSLGAGLSLLRGQLFMSLRMAQRPMAFTILTIASALLQLGMVVLFVPVLKQGSMGVVKAFAGSTAGSLVIGVAVTGWIWKGRFSGKLLWGMLAFGLPMLPAAVSLMAMESINKFMLLHLAGEEQTTLFGVASRIAGMISLLFFGFQMSWQPIAFKAMSDPGSAVSLYEKVSRYLAWMGGLGVAGLVLFGPELIRLLTKQEYLSARFAVPFLAFGAWMYAFYCIVCVGYQYANRTYHQAIAMTLGAIVVVPVAFWLIPLFGATGAAVSAATGFLVSLIYACRASAQYLKISYRWNKLLTWAISIPLLSILGGWFIPEARLTPFGLVPAAGKLVLLAAISLAGFYYLLGSGERAALRSKVLDARAALMSSVRGRKTANKYIVS